MTHTFGLIEKWGGLIEGLCSCSEQENLSDEIRSIIIRLKIIDGLSSYGELKVLSTFTEKEIDYINSPLLDDLVALTGIPINGAEGPVKNPRTLFTRSCGKSTRSAVFFLTKMVKDQSKILYGYKNACIENNAELLQILDEKIERMDLEYNIEYKEYLKKERKTSPLLCNYQDWVQTCILCNSFDALKHIASTKPELFQQITKEVWILYISNCIKGYDNRNRVKILDFLLYEKGLFATLSFSIEQYLKEAIIRSDRSVVKFLCTKRINFDTNITIRRIFFTYDHEPPRELSLLDTAFTKVDISIFNILLKAGASPVIHPNAIHYFLNNSHIADNTKMDFITKLQKKKATFIDNIPISPYTLLQKYSRHMNNHFFKEVCDYVKREEMVDLFMFTAQHPLPQIADIHYRCYYIYKSLKEEKIIDGTNIGKVMTIVCSIPSMTEELENLLSRFAITIEHIAGFFLYLAYYPHTHTESYFNMILDKVGGFTEEYNVNEYLSTITLKLIQHRLLERNDTYYTFLICLLKKDAVLCPRLFLHVLALEQYNNLSKLLSYVPIQYVSNYIIMAIEQYTANSEVLNQLLEIIPRDAFQYIPLEHRNLFTQEQLEKYFTKKHTLTETEDEQNTKRVKTE